MAEYAESRSKFVPPPDTLRVRVLASEFALLRLKALTDLLRVFLVTLKSKRPDDAFAQVLLGIETTLSDNDRAAGLTRYVCRLFETEFPDIQCGGVLWLDSLPDIPEARKTEFYAAAALIYDSR